VNCLIFCENTQNSAENVVTFGFLRAIATIAAEKAKDVCAKLPLFFL